MEGVRQAREMLRGVVPVSRVLRSGSLSAAGGAEVFLKLECEGPTGSFKVRGAYHAIRRQMEKGQLAGIVTSSTGNHGAATAYAAKVLGIPCRVYLPVHPNPVKRARIAEYGAEIVEAETYLEASRQHAARFAAESGWFNLVDGVEPAMLAGTATIGAEILEQVPLADVLMVPVGDTTLVRGLAFAAKQLRPEVRVTGVVAEGAPAYALSFGKGHAISTDKSDTIADGLAVREALEENVRELPGLVDDFRMVGDSLMLEAMRHLFQREGVKAEPSGAATTAAFLAAGPAFAGKTVVLVVSGRNAPEELFAEKNA